MHEHILLRRYSQNCYTYNNVVKNTYSPCHKDACVQISIGNTEWLLRYKGVSYTCFRGEKASFHREFWLGETPLGPSSRPRIDGLEQEKCNSIVNTLELCLSCTNPSICSLESYWWQVRLVQLMTCCHQPTWFTILNDINKPQRVNSTTLKKVIIPLFICTNQSFGCFIDDQLLRSWIIWPSLPC